MKPTLFLTSPSQSSTTSSSSKLLKPFLHFLPHRSHSPSPKLTPEQSLSSKEAPKSAVHVKKDSEIIVKTGAQTLPPSMDDFKPSKSVQIRVANICPKKDTKGPSPNIVNGNIFENLPRVKSRALKDRVIILKKVVRQIVDMQDPKPENGLESKPIRASTRKSKSSVPEEFLEKKFVPPDFTGILEGFLFRGKKSNTALNKPKDSIPLISSLTPKKVVKHTKGLSLNIQETTESSRKDSFSPSLELLSSKIKSQPKPSLFRLETEYELNQKFTFEEADIASETENSSSVGNFHKRVFSLGPRIRIERIKTEGSPRISPKRVVKKLAVQELVIESDSLESLQDLKDEDNCDKALQMNRQVDLEKKNWSIGSSLRTSPIDMKPLSPKLVKRSEKANKAKAKFNLALKATKVESKKETRAGNGNGWYLKPMISSTRKKWNYNQDDLELFSLVTAIRNPSNKQVSCGRQLE